MLMAHKIVRVCPNGTYLASRVSCPSRRVEMHSGTLVDLGEEITTRLQCKPFRFSNFWPPFTFAVLSFSIENVCFFLLDR